MRDSDAIFQDQYWSKSNQGMEFRHKKCLNFIFSNNDIKVLDLGCGDGFLLSKLKEKKIKAEGIDISYTAVKKAKEKGLSAEAIDFSAEKLPYNDNSFDYVVLLDVLEHLFNPKQVLAEAKRVSKKYLIISVPNFNSMPARVQVMLGKPGENNKAKKGHVYWFNLKILKNMLKKNNLEIAEFKINTFWQNKFLIKYLMKFLVKIFPSVFALSFVIKARKL